MTYLRSWKDFLILFFPYLPLWRYSMDRTLNKYGKNESHHFPSMLNDSICFTLLICEFLDKVLGVII